MSSCESRESRCGKLACSPISTITSAATGSVSMRSAPQTRNLYRRKREVRRDTIMPRTVLPAPVGVHSKGQVDQGEETMILNILTFLHVVSALVAIGFGAIVLVGILTRELLNKWPVRFSECRLVGNLTGMLFPFHQFLPTHWAYMLSVYLSGAAVLAWRKFHFAGIWSSIFAMSIPIVLYLDVLAVIVQVFKHIPSLMALAPTLSESPFLITEFVVVMPFVMYGIVAATRFHHEPPH